MSLPAYEAERWRLVDQTLTQLKVDIDRLWRSINQRTAGAAASSGGLTPTELAALTGAGSGGGGDMVKVFTIGIRGNPSGGSISWRGYTSGGTTTTGTWAWDDDGTDIATSLASVDSGVQTKGGTLKYNFVKIKFSSDVEAIEVLSHTLTRDDYGQKPKPELTYCTEPASWWE